ncbi:MAG TPA: M20/M25/M40 family metallo-hydrolase [Terriglobales bacterium]|nr:M20/M25/M40 family metallo-hydrolase [Terriglobales bacterium]
MPVDPQIAAAIREISAARIRAIIEKLVSFNSRNSLGSGDPTLKEKGQGVVAAREWIKSEFERYSAECGGCLEVHVDSFIQPPGERIPKPTEMTNVYAVLRGSDPDAAKRMVLVTGHYDTIVLTPLKPGEEPPLSEPGKPAPVNPGSVDLIAQAPGANDDGSGTAVSLECARVLSKHRFPGTIIFLTVPGEEQGLNGSLHFARMAKQEGWNLIAALNNDIVGGNRTPGDTGRNPRRVRVFSEGLPLAADTAEIRRIRRYGWENDSPSRQVARYISDVGRAYLPKFRFMPEMIFRADRFGRGGDHTSFNREGFAAVRLTEDREDLNHQHQYVRTENGIEYGDLPKFVDFDYTANVARVNAATLASLASGPPPPANVRINMRAPGNSTTLTWDAVPEGVSVEVLWRLTTAPDWQHARNVGRETRAVVDESKDNVMFAVRAVDKNGHRSLAVIPRPSGRERRVTYEE